MVKIAHEKDPKSLIKYGMQFCVECFIFPLRPSPQLPLQGGTDCCCLSGAPDEVAGLHSGARVE